MFSLDLILLMLAVGALGRHGHGAARRAAAASRSLVAAGTPSRCWRWSAPSLAKRLHSGPELQLGHGKLVGKQGLVTETVTALNPGRVRLAGEVWSAQPYDESLTIEPGETVEVFEIRGATAYVHPLPGLEA